MLKYLIESVIEENELKNTILNAYKSIYESIDYYKGEHESPDKDNGAPLYDVTINGIYPEDIYSSNGYMYCSMDEDNIALNIIKNIRNKPNTKITVYRAVPDLNKDINKKINDLWYLITYKKTYGFYPKNDLYASIRNKYDSNEDYDKFLADIDNDIRTQMSQLSEKIVKNPKIQNGDWVTIVPQYAINHGKDNLNNKYKIVKKTVKASEIYTDGNSLSEWGYWI